MMGFGRPKALPVAVTLVLMVVSLGGCAANSGLSDKFGVALNQDLAAQIADPDPHYEGAPAPGADGSRVALAQSRYQTGKVIAPVSTSTSEIGSQGAPGAP